jgi:hypothetical protein
MKKNVSLAVALLCVLISPVFGQTKKNPRKYSRPAPTRAFAAGNAGKSPEIKRPAEEASGIWNKFDSEKYGFTIDFPAQPEEIQETGRGKIASFETETGRAHYGVMRMSFPPLLDHRQLNLLGESLFADSYDAGTTRLISEENLCLDGMPGKQLVYEEAGKMFFTRFYILGQKLFMLSVSLPKTEYTKDFDCWATKFLDSFGAKKDAKFFG